MMRRFGIILGLVILSLASGAGSRQAEAQSPWTCTTFGTECCTVDAAYGGGSGTASCTSPGQIRTCTACATNMCQAGACCSCSTGLAECSSDLNQRRFCNCNWSSWQNCAVGGINKCNPATSNCVACEENGVPDSTLNRNNICDWGTAPDSCRYDCIGTTGNANVDCYSNRDCFLSNDGPCYELDNVPSAGCSYVPTPTPVACPWPTCSGTFQQCRTSGSNTFSYFCNAGSVDWCIYCPAGCNVSTGFCSTAPSPTPTPTPRCNAISCQNLNNGELCPWPNEKTGVYETSTWCLSGVFNCDTCGGMDCDYDPLCEGLEPTPGVGEPTWTPAPTRTPTPTSSVVTPTLPTTTSAYCEVEVVLNEYDENEPPSIVLDGYTVAAGQEIRVLLEQRSAPAFGTITEPPSRDGTELTKVPATPISYPGYTPSSAQYYLVTSCTTDATRRCSATAMNINTGIDNLKAGSYFVHCDASPTTVPGKCTGNPACNFKDEGYNVDCNALYDWVECDTSGNDRDYDYFTVNPIAPTPTPEVIVQARGRRVTGGSIAACSQITGTDYTDGATYSFDPLGSSTLPGATSDTQSGENYASWVVNLTGNHLLTIPALPGYSSYACIDPGTGLQEVGAPGSLSQSFDYLNSRTYTWEVGYAAASGYFQTRGADTYSPGVDITLSGGLPLGQQYFGFTDTVSSSDGVVISANSQNISVNNGGVSAANWQAEMGGSFENAAVLTQTLRNKLVGIAGTDTCGADCDDGTLTGGDITNCTTDDICTIDQDMTVNTDITVNQDTIVVIDGSLTINANIRHQPGVFLAFIVNGGNITVDPDVGTSSFIAATDNINTANAHLAGIYMTSGTFSAEEDPDPAADDPQLIVYGTVVANGIILSRFNSAWTATNPMEIFRYNPRLMFTMPTVMQDMPVRWEEVVPN